MMKIESRQLLGYAICLLAFLFITWSFFPGVMTPDSVASLEQGRTGIYSDINSPVMSWLLGRLDTLLAGPGLIFVIHIAIFWAACALLWSATDAKSRWLGIWMVLFGLMPQIVAPTVAIWKDVAMGTSLLMAV